MANAGSKRPYNDSTANSIDDSAAVPSTKRHRGNNNQRRRQQNAKENDSEYPEAKRDPTFGQQFVFPGLDGDEFRHPSVGDEWEFEDTGDALAYLRAVRQEASSVPTVLVAPRAGPQLPPHLQGMDDVDRSIYDDGTGDTRGYYQDGAYTAAPSPPPSNPSSFPEEEEEEEEEGEYHPGGDDDNDGSSGGPRSALTADQIARNNARLRKAYYDSLAAQFLSLRALLHRTPPADLVAALPREHGTHVGSFGPKSLTFRVWSRRIRTTDPLPVQVAALDRHAVLKLLRVILGGKFMRRGHELRERTSRWIWALLARLPEVGELHYAEVGWVRELGKRAVLMMVSMAQMAALQREVDGDLEGEVMGGGGGDDDDDEEEEEEDGGFAAELVVDSDDEGAGVRVGGEPGSAGADAEVDVANKASTSTSNENNEDEEGEMDMDLDDGEVSSTEDATAGNRDMEADIAAAKARLLARVDEAPSKQEGESAAEADAELLAELDEARAEDNMRATLNMILTVAGEFYGQRDLLEFRDPFPAL
ncbi:hypothetical protein VTK26DRAFT_6880 [Humicola hyalothermophila]